MKTKEKIKQLRVATLRIHTKASALHDSIYKLGRNNPCKCGSGKKFKKCCLNEQDNNRYRLQQYKDSLNALHHRIIDLNKI